MTATRRFGSPFIDPRGNTGQMDSRALPAHLADSSTTIQWAKSTLPELVPETGSAPKDSKDVFSAGQLVEGKYEIRGVLGAGGMGQVFEAKDVGLNRLVALKAAWPHVGADPLRREAQVLAAFRHPGLVTVHALGSDAGVEFLVMERLSGTTLADFLIRKARQPVALKEAVGILVALADALAPLHASGLAHADVKPANIMLSPGDRMVLLDFGIARIEQLRSGAQRITGSPHYMAPEAIRGAVGVGAAHLVDLYAVGVIAFVMLTGEAPFDHPNPIELMVLHLHEEAPRVSSKRPEVPPALDNLVADLMAKDPADRTPDVEVLRAELRRIQARL